MNHDEIPEELTTLSYFIKILMHKHFTISQLDEIIEQAQYRYDEEINISCGTVAERVDKLVIGDIRRVTQYHIDWRVKEMEERDKARSNATWNMRKAIDNFNNAPNWFHEMTVQLQKAKESYDDYVEKLKAESDEGGGE